MIKRKLLKELIAHLNSKDISLIVGSRQVGKTTIMKELKAILDQRGEKTCFLNLDFEPDKNYFSSQTSFLSKLDLEFGRKPAFVFIDEIQRKEDAGVFLKGLYDLGLPYKFIVSGSGSLELKEKIHESLAGRKRQFELDPISIEEFINYKTSYKYEQNLSAFFETEKDKRIALLLEYLNFGGYPRVILEDTANEKIKIMDEIYKSYIEKDIVYLLKIERADAYDSLVKLLGSQIGYMVNYSKLASTIGISVPTLKHYLWYAEKTFIVRKLTPFFRNIKKEISKSPAIYFSDLGLRNYATGRFGLLSSPDETAFAFQNLVYNILRQKTALGNFSINFWRTIDKAEVDFIISKNKQTYPIEVKYTSLKKPEIQKSLRSFIEKYKPKCAWVVNLDYQDEISIGTTKVRFIPLYHLFSEDFPD